MNNLLRNLICAGIILLALPIHAQEKVEYKTIVYTSDALANEISKLNTDYLLHTQMWFIEVALPLILVFGVMCIVTILLTRKSFKTFTPDIASALSKGRKRQ